MFSQLMFIAFRSAKRFINLMYIFAFGIQECHEQINCALLQIDLTKPELFQCGDFQIRESRFSRVVLPCRVALPPDQRVELLPKQNVLAHEAGHRSATGPILWG